MVVTTPRRPSREDEEAARDVAERLGLPLVRRRGLAALEGVVLVAGSTERAVRVPGQPPLRFHGSMGVLRVRRLVAGDRDSLLDALALPPGATVIDATAGLGSDALVIAHAAAEVIALETNPLLFALLDFGVRRPTGEPAIDAALARIRPVLADHRAWLAARESASADAVYLDPMFRVPSAAPPGFGALRALADPRPLDAQTLAHARRVARGRVIVQDAARGGELERLGLSVLPAGRHAATRFGAA